MSIAVELGENRYDRQERIGWWDQERLAQSRVLVIGAGALGIEVVKNLALVGVGSILVVDFDTIELSNLARCVFFREEDEGRPKASTLAERAGALNPNVKVHGIDGDARAFGAGIGLRADVMVGALDSREARLFVNKLAWRVGRPWVDGAIEALSGIARVFSPPDSCYECTLTEADFEILAHRQSCRLLSREDLLEGKVPTTATTSSIIAGLQAQEVVKLLHHDVEGVRSLEGAIVFDGANNDAYPLRYPFDEDCLAHHTYTDPVVWEPAIDATFADLTASVGWDDAVVELGDDHVVRWTCPGCETVTPAGAPVALVRFGDAECPKCGEVRQPEAFSSIGVPGDHAALTLVDLGVRPDEILAVRRGLDYRYVWAKSPAPELPEEWR